MLNLRPLNKAIHTAEAVFVIFVAAHEIEAFVPIFDAPLDQIGQQHPTGGVVVEIEIDPSYPGLYPVNYTNECVKIDESFITPDRDRDIFYRKSEDSYF